MNTQKLYPIFAVMLVLAMVTLACSLGTPMYAPQGAAETAVATSVVVPPPTTFPTSVPGAPTPTTAPASNGDVCYLVGGRYFDYSATGNEWAGKALKSWLQSGAPLQEFWSQIAAHASTPAGFKTAPDKFEVANDGLKAVICGDIVLLTPIAIKEVNHPVEGDGIVTFNEVSFLTLNDQTMDICSSDEGGPGQFIGACSGDVVTIKARTTLNTFLALDEYKHYAAVLKTAMADTTPLTKDQPFVILSVFTK